MSWSIDIKGTKAGATAQVIEQLDKVAATYEGKEEGKDVLAVKERLVSLIDAVELGSDGRTVWNFVQVKANGSHWATDKGILSAAMQFTVERLSVALDPES